jgi:small subunit ribosomal protein S14
MARKGLLQRQIKREQLVLKYAKKRQILLSEVYHATSYEKCTQLQRQLQRLPRDSSATRLRNRCWKTGRGRGVYKDFGLSRHVLREMCNDGLVTGLVKSSW